jgi:hypothetical protein
MRFLVLLLASIGLAFGCSVAINDASAKTTKPAAKSAAPAPDADSHDDDVAQPTSLDNLKNAPPAPQLACSGPFAKDTTHAKLVTEFGAKNVTFQDVQDHGGVTSKATVVFDADPTKRVVVLWNDLKNRSKPSSILIEAPSTWQGPGGIRNGLPLKELEKMNGGVFSIKGFGGSGGGGTLDLKGPFTGIDGGCALSVTFEPGIANPLPPRFAAITGDITVVSTNFLLRRARPQVTEWNLRY